MLGPESNATSSAFVGRARPERRPPLTDEQKRNRTCHECGKKGHIRPACPLLNKDKHDKPDERDATRVAAAEKKMNGKKSRKSLKAASSSSESDEVNSDYDAFGYKAVHSPTPTSYRAYGCLLALLVCVCGFVMHDHVPSGTWQLLDYFATRLLP